METCPDCQQTNEPIRCDTHPDCPQCPACGYCDACASEDDAALSDRIATLDAQGGL